MQKKLTAAAVASALALGGAAAIAVPALAASSPSPSPSASSSPSPSGPRGEQGTQNRADRIKAALKSLVDDGTITQDQADKVADKLAGAGPGGMGGPRLERHQWRGGPGGGPGMMGAPGLMGQAMEKAEQSAASAIGISVDQLRRGLQQGKTLAQLAKDHGKTTDDVVNPLVAAAKDAIAQAVKDGKVTQQQADRITPNLEQRIRQAVENGHFPMRLRDRQGGGPGQDRQGKDGDRGQARPAPGPEGMPSPPELPPPSGPAPSGPAPSSPSGGAGATQSSASA